MPKHTRHQSDLGRLMPGIVRFTDASGATVYSSHPYEQMKGHARGASASTLVNNDFEGWSDDTPSAGLHDMRKHEALGFEDEDREDDDYEDRGHMGHEALGSEDDDFEDRGHEGRHPP
jgi:hypothetical protein